MDQSKACSQQRGRDVPKKEKYSKGGDMPSGSSQHMREEWQIGGGTKGEIMALGGGQAIIGRW